MFFSRKSGVNQYSVNFLSIAIAALFLASCAAPVVKQNVLVPANSSGFQQAKKVAIIEFSGDRSDEFSNKLGTFFAGVTVKNKPYFTVVDQEIRKSILAERKFQIENGLILGAEATEFGKISGADTIISGFVKWPSFTNKAYEEERKKCILKSKEKSKGLLGSYYKCLQHQKYIVACNKRTGSFNFTVKAVSVKTGEVVHNRNYTAAAEDKHCSDSGTTQKEASTMGPIMVNQAIAKMRQDVAPYVIVMTIKLMDDDDSELDGNKHAEKLFESGLKFAKNNRMQRACSLFDEASKSYQSSPAILHNLGVCAEMNNKFDLAVSFYQKADNLLLKPEKLINAALTRIGSRMQKEKAVKEQLR